MLQLSPKDEFAYDGETTKIERLRDSIEERSGGINGLSRNLGTLTKYMSETDIRLFLELIPGGAPTWEAYKERRDAPSANGYDFRNYVEEVFAEYGIVMNSGGVAGAAERTETFSRHALLNGEGCFVPEEDRDKNHPVPPGCFAMFVSDKTLELLRSHRAHMLTDGELKWVGEDVGCMSF